MAKVESSSLVDGIREGEFQIWEEYRRDASPEKQEMVVGFYLPLAKLIAAKMYGRRINDEVEFDDYLQYARVGLLEAIAKFDSTCGARFNSFADARIKGAILNALEFQTEKQQQVSMSKRLRRERLNSCKDMAGVDKATRDDPDYIFRYLADVSVGMALSWLLDDTGLTEFDDSVVIEAPFYRSVELKQLQDQIRRCVDELEEQERKFVRYHYFQGICMGEVAEILSLSRSRVSQINQSALRKLKRILEIQRWDGLTC